MNKLARITASATLALSAALLPSLSATAAEVPDVVLDGGNMLSAQQEASLTNAIGRDNAQYGLGFVVETIPALDGRDIEQLALTRANELGVGSAASNNGVYLLIARDDHKIQMELGSGVDDRVSDATVEQIIADDMTPAFRQENYAGGIEAALTAVGQAYTGTEAATPVEEPLIDAGTQRWLADAGKIALIALACIAGIALLAGLIWLVRALAEYRHLENLHRLNRRHSEAVEELVEQLQTLEGSQSDEFDALPDDEARRSWLALHMAPLVTKDEDFAEELYSQAMRQYVKEIFEQVEYKLSVKWGRQYRLEAQGISIQEAVRRFESDTLKEKERQQREAKRAAEAARIAREERRKAEEARAKEAAKQEAAAKKFWGKLDIDQRAAVRRARTKADKRRVLEGYGIDSTQSNVFFPVLLALYAGEVGHPQSSSSHHSSSSSSSSSSYSGGSDFSSSFGGGSFDGGGGGGSW